ncbi:MAG TPA: CotH kinase family protein, partial [Candidatus Paceibacterota bacterium]|nr:CotH kinase family protein [Candidatus Paceibacterota bacterium]
AMDPNVTATYAEQMTNALRSLPSVFVTTTISNLFDSTYGIYSHPLKTGVTWERPIAIEMVDTNGSTEFQENCGLRIQGGVFFRDFSFTQKKSFRVLFKGIYGTGKLHHDLFKERGAAEEFDGFVLRAGANDGYAWGGAGTTVQFIRDEFGRRLNLAMGHPTGRGMFVHLYLNGLYWGMYNLAERPNEDFSASYLGGVAEEWDACAAGDFKNGGTAASTRWNTFLNQANAVTTFDGYQTMQGRNADGTPNPAVPCYFDRENYLDYMILNMWGGNWDWPNKNFWFGYNTNDNTGYKFYVWDFENVMGNSRDRSPLNMVSPRSDVAAQWVGLPHYHLKDYPEYQLDFADRVQRHFFNGGLLTPEVLTNRYHALADSVQAAIIAESARWGDDNHTPAYGLPEWLGERDWILTNYLPQRTSIVLTQFISGGLFPSVLAPAFNQFGGTVPAGFTLSMTNPNSAGTIFYTLNGTDPRVPGSGAVSGSAQSYAGGIAINAPTEIRARVLNGSWSPVVVAVFYPPQDLSKLALTEIMYHAPNVGATNGDEFDFIELKNTGTNTLNLSGLTFTSGVTFTFTNGTTIAPGEFAVFARNAAAMAAKYPAVPLRGLFTGKLDNGGEAITLSLPTGQKV